MRTMAGRDSMLNDSAGAASDGLSVASLSPPTRRRPSWIAFGALLVGLAGLLGAYVFSVMSDTIAVTVASHDLEPGEVLGPEDIRVVEMGRTGDLRAVQSDQQDLIVGLSARGPIPAGTVLNTGLFVASDQVIPPGRVVVGALLEAGAIPTRSLRPGDEVGMIEIVDDSVRVAAQPPSGVSELGTATVWAIEGDPSAQSATDRIWVSLVVDGAVQLQVSQAAADETLRLVLLGAS